MTAPRSLLDFAESQKKPQFYERVRPFLEEINKARELGVPWTVIHKWIVEEHGIQVGYSWMVASINKLNADV